MVRMIEKNLTTSIGLYFSIALSLIFIVWMGVIGTRFPETGQPRMVALEIASTSDAYRGILDGWLGDPPDAAGLAALRASFWVDFGFIAGYTLMLMSCLGNLRNDLDGFWGWMFRLPILVGLLDGVENIFHLLLLETVEGGVPLPAVYSSFHLLAGSTASHGKWILFAVVSIAILILYVRNFRTIRPWPRFWIGVVLLALVVFDLAYFSELLR